jgi:hypothetical protein
VWQPQKKGLFHRLFGRKPAEPATPAPATPAAASADTR